MKVESTQYTTAYSLSKQTFLSIIVCQVFDVASIGLSTVDDVVVITDTDMCRILGEILLANISWRFNPLIDLQLGFSSNCDLLLHIGCFHGSLAFAEVLP